MGIEQPATFYDGMYTRREKYFGDYTKNSCFKCGLWPAAVKHLNNNDVIFEAGCGSGQFAQYVYTKVKPKSYFGIDFSPVAIELALNKAPLGIFLVRDLTDDDDISFRLQKFNVFVALEFLEHINEDLKILNKVKALDRKIKVITSVPDFNSAGHVRHFKSEQKIRNRYESIINNLEIEYFGGRWLMIGEINTKKSQTKIFD